MDKKLLFKLSKVLFLPLELVLFKGVIEGLLLRSDIPWRGYDHVPASPHAFFEKRDTFFISKVFKGINE